MVRLFVEETMGSTSAFAAKVSADGAAKLAKLMKGLEAEVVAETQKIIREEFVTDRDPSRRKKGTRRLVNSIVCEMDWNQTSFPITLKVHAIGDQGKIGALEKGAPMHEIPLSPKSGVGKDFIFYPRTRAVHKTKTSTGTVRTVGQTRPGAPGAYGKYGRAGVGRDVVKAVQVVHPGNQHPRHFMERGLRRVVERRLRNARV